MKKVFFNTLMVFILLSKTLTAQNIVAADYNKAKELFKKKMSFAFYDIEKVMSSMPEYEKVSKELMEFEEKIKVEGEKAMQDLQSRMEKINTKDPSKMTESEKTEMNAIYEEAQKLNEELKRRKSSKQKALVEPMANKIKNAVSLVKKKLEIDAIFNKMVIEDCDERFDISNFVLKELGIELSTLENKPIKNIANAKSINSIKK